MYTRFEKAAGYLSLILLVVSLLPVIWLGRYNHPTGDDYYYGAAAKQVLEETGSLLDTVRTAAAGVAYEYENWQGTYSAMFLMYLPPNLFGDWAYRLFPGIMLLTFTGGIFYLLKPAFCHWMQCSRFLWILCSCVTAMLAIQTVPSPGESFYWYNGSMYYTGYLTATLFFFGWIERWLITSKIRYFFYALPTAVFLAGGNYVSLLPSVLLLVTLAGILFIRRSRHSAGLTVIICLLLAGFAVSACAPGNRIRQSGMWQIPAWKAILKSLRQGIFYLHAWINIWWLAACALLTPVFWRTYRNISFCFRYPLIVLGYLYGIFCSMSCPTFYTMNSTGPARVIAIVYYAFILFTLAGYYYLLGYLYRRLEHRKNRQIPCKRRFGHIPPVIRHSLCPGICFLLLLIQCAAGDASDCTVSKAVRLLANGDAAAYEQEYQMRLEILADNTIRDAVFSPYRHQPDMLYVGDFTEDPLDPTNVRVAQYFNKNSVIVDYSLQPNTPPQ